MLFRVERNAFVQIIFWDQGTIAPLFAIYLAGRTDLPPNHQETPPVDKPNCVKCGSRDFMIEEDSGPTFNAWRCDHCDRRTEKKTGVGKTLPFIGPAISLALLLIGIDIDLSSSS